MRSRFVCALAFIAVVAGCHNYKKSGDRAAATGNWKAAEAEYRVAVQKNPKDPALRDKWMQAKTEAVNQAKGRAQRCIEEKNWECAQQEADYAAAHAEADPVAQTLKRQARAGRALQHLGMARAEIPTNVVHTFDLVDFANGLSTEDDVLREAQAVSTEAVGAALAQADDLRRQAAGGGEGAGAMLDHALVMLGKAQRFDPVRVEPALAAVRADKDRWVAQEYERIAVGGDAALARHEWPAAIAAYQHAEQLKPGGRAQSGIRYANLVSSADGAANARDFAAAANGYAQAMTLADDRDRYAAAQHDRVVLRRWKLKLASVVLHPLKPDGNPWMGKPSRVLAEVVANVVRNPQNFHAINRMPLENQPFVLLEVTLPDGRKFRTQTVRGLFAQFPAELVFDSNAYEDRSVDVRVIHDAGGGAPLDVDTIRIPLRDVVAGARTAPAGKSVLRFDLQLTPAQNLAEGFVNGMAQLANETNATTTYSQPYPGATGFALTRVEALVKGLPLPNGATQPSSPRVEIWQRGAVVYRSPESPGTSTLDAAPRATFLFVGPNDPLTVKILDGAKSVNEGRLTLANLKSGSAEVGHAQSAWTRLTLTPRPPL